MIVNILKCKSQCFKSMYPLAISMSLLRYTMSLIIFLRCFQDNLSSSEVDKLLHFSITLINSFFENKFHFVIYLQGISSSNWGSIWQTQAKLNDRWCYDSIILELNQRKESYIKVNTRELNRELCTRLFTLYTKLP